VQYPFNLLESGAVTLPNNRLVYRTNVKHDKSKGEEKQQKQEKEAEEHQDVTVAHLSKVCSFFLSLVSLSFSLKALCSIRVAFRCVGQRHLSAGQPAVQRHRQ
jgi:hypothetical protein